MLNFAMIEILWCFFSSAVGAGKRNARKLNCKIYLVFVNGGGLGKVYAYVLLVFFFSSFL